MKLHPARAQTRGGAMMLAQLGALEAGGPKPPAMAAGVTDKLWEIGDVVEMADDYWARKKENSN